MIVKDEHDVIVRCLESVKPFIHHWCIVDTGSTDNTKELIKEALKGIPGELHERPWRGFGPNRTEAFALAKDKADYALVIDADDVLKPAPGFTMPDLTLESYELQIEYDSLSYDRLHLFRNDIAWRYEGVLHEYPTCDKDAPAGRIPGLIYKIVGGGARHHDPEKYRKDALVLAKALKSEPNNARYMFYLAQSWKDAGEPLKALAAYERRASMTNGFYEEVFISLLEIARIKQRVKAPEHEIVRAHVRAYEYLPHRIEPLFELARWYRSQDRFAAAYLYAKFCLDVPMPTDKLFVTSSVYEWEALDEYAINAYYVASGVKKALTANQSLLANPKLPETERPRIQKNLEFCLTSLGLLVA